MKKRTLSKLLASAVILLATSTAAAAAAIDSWSTDDQRLFWLSQTAITLDWITTRQMASAGWPNDLYETNKILGRKPHKDSVDVYMIAMLATNYWIADSIHKDMRTRYLGLRIVTHTAAALNNRKLIVEYRVGF